MDLIEATTGRAPFRGEGVAELLNRIQKLEPESPRRIRPGIPRDLEIICLKALEKDPAHRYASAAELADDLDRFLRGEAIRARPASLPVRLGRSVKRHAVALAIAASLLLALIMAIRPRAAAPTPAPPDDSTARELLAEASTLTAPGVAEKRHRLLYRALDEAVRTRSEALIRKIEDRLGRGDALSFFAFAITGVPPEIGEGGPPEATEALRRATSVPSEALAEAGRALEHDPNSWRAWLVLVAAHLRDGNPSEAREAARRARLLAPDLKATTAFEALALRARWHFAGGEEEDPLRDVDRSDPVIALAASILPRIELERDGRVRIAVEDPPDAVPAVSANLRPLRAWARLASGDTAGAREDLDAHRGGGLPEWEAFVHKLREAVERPRTPWVLLAQARRGDAESRIAALLEELGPADRWKDLTYRWPGLIVLAEARLARGDRDGAKAALRDVPPSIVENHPNLRELVR